MRLFLIKGIFVGLTISAIVGCNSNTTQVSETVNYIDCSYFAMRIEKEEFYQHTKCGMIDKTGLIQLTPEVVALMDFDAFKEAVRNRPPEDRARFPLHLQCLPVGPAINGSGRGGLAYFNEDGKGRMTPSWDARCMPFLEGISYSYVDGNVVYFNTDLEIVKHTEYRFANWRLVCSETPYKYYKPGTYEHPEWRGGKCGRIDQDFKVVVPLKYTYEDVPSFNPSSEHINE